MLMLFVFLLATIKFTLLGSFVTHFSCSKVSFPHLLSLAWSQRLINRFSHVHVCLVVKFLTTRPSHKENVLNIGHKCNEML